MKKSLFIGFITTLLIMTGCSSKNPSPEVGAGENGNNDTTNTSPQTIITEVIEESSCCDKPSSVAIMNGGGAVNESDMNQEQENVVEKISISQIIKDHKKIISDLNYL